MHFPADLGMYKLTVLRLAVSYIIIQWKRVLQMEIVNFIHLCYLTRSSCEKCNYRPLAGIEPAIPVQRSNQLSYRETVVEL